MLTVVVAHSPTPSMVMIDRYMKNILMAGEDSKEVIERSFESMFGEKIWIHKVIDQILGKNEKRKFMVCEHHISHAASAFYPSPYEKAVIITIDGVGDTTFCAEAAISISLFVISVSGSLLGPPNNSANLSFVMVLPYKLKIADCFEISGFSRQQAMRAEALDVRCMRHIRTGIRYNTSITQRSRPKFHTSMKKPNYLFFRKKFRYLMIKNILICSRERWVIEVL